MKKIQNAIPYALSLLALTAAQSVQAVPLAAPTSGAYVDDAQNTWVQDRVGDRIGTVNMIMCIISSLRGDAMVNQGPYVALVDENKCQGRGDSSKSSSTSAGATNAANFMNGVVQSTQASVNDPLIIKAWLHEDGEDGQSKIYLHITATEGKSDTNPNGVFAMHFCGEPSGTSGCAFKGSLVADSSGLRFYEDEGGGGGGGSVTQLILQGGSGSTGSGLIRSTHNSTPSDFSFAYNNDNFRRSGDSVDTCLSRDTADAVYSTWRYGTYQSNGARLESQNGGFPVKYVRNNVTYYGYWGFWGLSLPESAQSHVGIDGELTRHVGSADVPLTVDRKHGKLWKLTRQNAALGSFKNVSMMFWSPVSVGSLDSGASYELQWDGELLKAIGKQNCSNGNQCAMEAMIPVTLHASDFRSSNAQTLQIFFPSGGSNGTLEVPASGDFATDNVLSYRTRDIVAPNASNAPASLTCVSMCPKSGSDLTTAFPGTSQNSPEPFLAQSWSPVLIASVNDYTFSGGMLSGSNGTVDASDISKDDLRNYQWGLTSGSMLDSADLSAAQCDANGTANTSGAYVCPGLVDKAQVIYQWETGPNQWNQYFGAAGVTIDPPKSLVFTATSNNIRAADISKYVGNDVQLQFNGFGELQGIPGKCVNPNTNEPEDCNQDTRWVPGFDIKDGSTVSGGGSTYFVKYLERELRLGQLTGSAETTCKATLALPNPSSLSLPDATLHSDPRVLINAPEPTPASTKPSVIDGIVQTGT
ncbi:MAG: hypothetical protein EOP38_00060 [Rubrivivax sp.]|nr:MAG: hypothetical protein EOP38_00060 [Rubrivivax sp.]